MITRLKLAFLCYSLAIVGLAAMGLLYFFRSEFMPYHAQAAGKTWAELDPGLRWLLLAYLKFMSGAWLAVSLAIGFMLFIPFRRGEAWARLAIPLVGLVSYGTALYGTLLVTFNTPASPPWLISALGVALIMAGFIFSIGQVPRLPGLIRGEAQSIGSR